MASERFGQLGLDASDDTIAEREAIAVRRAAAAEDSLLGLDLDPR